jgi:glutamyl/glutaminyl-tRNA synthetase
MSACCACARARAHASSRQEDAIEGITHSICTLEFVPHRELYDWFIASFVDLVPHVPLQVLHAHARKRTRAHTRAHTHVRTR